MTVKKESILQKPEFTKEQILEAKKYEKQKDILDSVLDKNQSYTETQVQKEAENFMRRKVN